jgi:hypothetical protein
MLGLIGIALMITLSVLYFNELGWRWLLGAWAIVLLAPFLLLVGVSGWLILLLQGAVVASLYLKAKSEG